MAVSIPGTALLPPSSLVAVSTPLLATLGKAVAPFPEYPVSPWTESDHVLLCMSMPMAGEFH